MSNGYHNTMDDKCGDRTCPIEKRLASSKI